MKNFKLLNVLLAMAVLVSCGQNLKKETAKKNKKVLEKPNIIILLADDLGYGELGAYGQKVIKTPFLDEIASKGLKFTDFYAGTSVCSPSRAVLMTGKHTGHLSIRGNKGKLSEKNGIE